MNKNKTRNRAARMALFASAGLLGLGLVACSKATSNSETGALNIGGGAGKSQKPPDSEGSGNAGQANIDVSNPFVFEKELTATEFGALMTSEKKGKNCNAEIRSSKINPDVKVGEIYGDDFYGSGNNKYTKTSGKFENAGHSFEIMGTTFRGRHISTVLEKSDRRVLIQREYPFYSIDGVISASTLNPQDGLELKEYLRETTDQPENWSMKITKEMKINPEFERECKEKFEVEAGKIKCKWVKNTSKTEKFAAGHIVFGANTFEAIAMTEEFDGVFNCDGIEKNFRQQEINVQTSALKKMGSNICGLWMEPAFTSTTITNLSDKENIIEFKSKKTRSPLSQE